MRILILALFYFISVTALGQKKILTRNLNNFNAIEIKGSIDIVYAPSTRYSLEIKGEYPEDITTEIKGSELIIYHKKGKNWFSNEWNTVGKGYVVVVHAPSLNKIKLSGSGNFSIEGLLKSDQLKVNIDGSGNLTGKINVGLLNLESNGSSNIRLSGNVQKAILESYGSGNFQSFDLIIDDCTISKMGSGNSQISVNHSLTASISGSGNLTYKGTPSDVNAATSGSGKIKKAQ